MSASSENVALDDESVLQEVEEKAPEQESPQIESGEVPTVNLQTIESDNFTESEAPQSEVKTTQDETAVQIETQEESMPTLDPVEIPESVNAMEMESAEPELAYQETLPSDDAQIIPMETDSFDEIESLKTTPASQVELSLVQQATHNKPPVQSASPKEPSSIQVDSPKETSIQVDSPKETSIQVDSPKETSIQVDSPKETSVQVATQDEPDSQKELSVTELPLQEVSVNESTLTQPPSISEQVTPTEPMKNDLSVKNELSAALPSAASQPSEIKETTATVSTLPNPAVEGGSATKDKNTSNEHSPSSSQAKSVSEHSNEPQAKRRKMDDDVKNCPTGLYLDKTVVPILRMALITLDRLRPEDPMQYVIDFLLQNKEKFSPGEKVTI